MVTERMNETGNESPPLTVLYDGACPLCRREIGIYRGLRPYAPVCFADVSDASQQCVWNAMASAAEPAPSTLGYKS